MTVNEKIKTIDNKIGTKTKFNIIYTEKQLRFQEILVNINF